MKSMRDVDPLISSRRGDESRSHLMIENLGERRAHINVCLTGKWTQMSNGTDVLSWDDAYDDMSSQGNRQVPYARDEMGLEARWYKSLLAATLLLGVG